MFVFIPHYDKLRHPKYSHFLSLMGASAIAGLFCIVTVVLVSHAPWPTVWTAMVLQGYGPGLGITLFHEARVPGRLYAVGAAVVALLAAWVVHISALWVHLDILAGDVPTFPGFSVLHHLYMARIGWLHLLVYALAAGAGYFFACWRPRPDLTRTPRELRRSRFWQRSALLVGMVIGFAVAAALSSYWWNANSDLTIGPEGRFAVAPPFRIHDADGSLANTRSDGGKRVTWSSDGRWLLVTHRFTPFVGEKPSFLCNVDGQSADVILDKSQLGAWSTSANLFATAHTQTVGKQGHRATIEVWDATTFLTLTTATIEGAVRSLALSADGHWLAAGQSDGTVSLWDLQTGGSPQEWNALSPGPQNSLLFTPDSQTLVTAGLFDRAVTLWDPAQPRRSRGRSFPVDLDCTTSLAVAPDGRSLFVGGGVLDDHGVMLDLDPRLGSEKRRFLLPGHGVYQIGCSWDGRTLFATTTTLPGYDPREEASIYRWDLDTGQPLPPYR